MKIAVQTEDFDVQAEVAALHASPKVGAVVMFLGTVRDLNEGDEVASMTLEHYPGMTEKHSRQSWKKQRSGGTSWMRQ